MRLLASAAFGMICLVVQTALLSRFQCSSAFFDLLMPIVLYVSIRRPFSESLPLIFFFGILQGGLSGGPFGLHLVIYAWLLFGARGSMQLLDVGSFFIFPLLVAAGVVIENIFLAVVAREIFQYGHWFMVTKTVLIQTILGIMAAPFFLIIQKKAHSAWDHTLRQWRRAQEEDG